MNNNRVIIEKMFFSLVLGFVIVSTFNGCALKEVKTTKVIDTIIVKNSTGINIKKVSIIIGDGRNGSISPIPPGISQVYGRGSKVKRLPETVEIRWIDDANKFYKKHVSTKLSSTLDSSRYRTTIVFELMPGGMIKVIRE